MSDELNFFKYLILIESKTAEGLTLKLQAIPFAFHYLKVWSDGKRHYAHINMQRPLPAKAKDALAKIK